MVGFSSLGLVISSHSQVRKTRLLPVRGEVRVQKGMQVDPETTVAYAEVPGYPVPVNIAFKLGVEPSDIEKLMLKKKGDVVREGESLARKKLFLGLSEDVVRSPIDGTVESVSFLNGMVILRSHPVPVTTTAHISGEVVEVLEGEGVVIETPAALVQGIFGIGGERHGAIHLAVDSPDEILDATKLTPQMKGKVVVGGSLITLDAVRKALGLGIAGLVGGGVNDKDLSAFLGYDIGLIITGQEHFGLSLIVTEGFGHISMSTDTFALLKSLEGKMASINGTTHIRAGVTRPEIIIPRKGDEKLVEIVAPLSLEVGKQVRVTRYPFFGQEAKLLKILDNGTLPSGIKAPVGEILFEDGATLVVPLANLEPLTTRKDDKL